MLGYCALEASLPWMFGKILDNIEHKRANWMLFWFFLAGFGQAVLNTFQGYSTFRLVAEVKRKMRYELLSSILHQETGYFDENTSGELTSRLNNDVSRVTDRLVWTMRTTMMTIFTIVATLIFAFIMNVRLTICSFAC
eukprot:UN34152